MENLERIKLPIKLPGFCTILWKWKWKFSGITKKKSFLAEEQSVYRRVRRKQLSHVFVKMKVSHQKKLTTQNGLANHQRNTRLETSILKEIPI